MKPQTQNDIKMEYLPNPVKLTWVTDSILNSKIKDAAERAKTLSRGVDMIQFDSDLYGTRYIEQIAGANADVYLHLQALTAYRRIHKDAVKISTGIAARNFDGSRNENLNVVTTEAWKLAVNFDRDDMLVFAF